jgi:hypothetical protein
MHQGNGDAHSQVAFSYPCFRVTILCCGWNGTVQGGAMSSCIKCQCTRRVTSLQDNANVRKNVMAMCTPEWAKFIVSNNILLTTPIW